MRGRRGDFLERLRAADELVERLDDGGEAGPVRALLLPRVQHQLVDGLGAVHGRRQPEALLDRLDHLLVRPVPVRPLAVRHHLRAGAKESGE